MHEKRRYKRFLVHDMDISGRMTFVAEVKVLNISMSGIAVMADKRMEIGKEYSLMLEDQDREIELRGLVMWSSISGTREGTHGDQIPVYSAGLKFTNILNERMLELLSFIDDHKKGSDHRLQGLRFNITDPEKATLFFPSEYRVLKISFGGMLIESFHPLSVEERFPMEITLPEDSSITFVGRVASCFMIKGKGPEHFEIGIEFIEMSEENRKKIRNFTDMLDDVEGEASSL